MSNPDRPVVTVTRWWWVRHAPVRSDGGNIYGQKDIECDCSDREVFEAVAKILPRNAVWYSSNLKRTHKTAEAIWAAGYPKPASMTQERDFAEQHPVEDVGGQPAAIVADRRRGVGRDTGRDGLREGGRAVRGPCGPTPVPSASAAWESSGGLGFRQ